MIAMLLVLLQAAAPSEGMRSLWELTVAADGARPVVSRVCEPPRLTEPAFIASLAALDPPGAQCDAPVMKRTPAGWSRDRVCRSGGGVVTIHAARTGVPDNDVTYRTAVETEGSGRRSLSTRLRRLGPCPGDPEEPVKGPVRCPTRGALACGR